jgi:2,3-bisphosphoglycerate-independent phosphoglycerate mutase
MDEIESERLRSLVVEHLEPYGPDVIARYHGPALPVDTIVVESLEEGSSPYSRGRHSQDLLAAGLTQDEAAHVSEAIYVELLGDRRTHISSDELRALTYDHIEAELGQAAAHRYDVWQEFMDSNRPLIVLIGGAVGCGKSTIATELAHRLQIVRIQSSDMLREVMRTMIHPRLLPVLHESTYTAWTRRQDLTEVDEVDADPLDEDMEALLEGYQNQSDLVSVASDAVLRRAIRERVSIIVEGVHVQPGFARRIPVGADAIVVHVTLAVLKKKRLKARIRGRSGHAPDRRAERYLSSTTTTRKRLPRRSSGSSWTRSAAISRASRRGPALEGPRIRPGATLARGAVVSVRWKGLVIILDGLGDDPSPELKGRTPLQAAYTPVLDLLVQNGVCGRTDPLRPGQPVDTPTGTSVLLGVPPERADALARGPVEAAGVGLPVQSGDVVIRCNFATLERNGRGGLVVMDRRAGRIQQGTDELAATLGDLDLGEGVVATVRPASQHRGVVRLRGPGLSPAITDTDPGISAGPASILPCRPLESSNAKATRTAAAVNRFLERAFPILEAHPVNAERRATDRPPANGLITRGAGQVTDLDSAITDAGLDATVVAGERTVVGLGRLLAFDVVTEPGFNGLPDTDLAGKTAAAAAALERSDLVYLHIKAPDINAHDRDPVGKVRTLERIDAALAGLPMDDRVVAVCGDHSTSSSTGEHTGEPVPAILSVPGGPRDDCDVFDEPNCAQGGLGRLPAASFVRRVLDAMGAGDPSAG